MNDIIVNVFLHLSGRVRPAKGVLGHWSWIGKVLKSVKKEIARETTVPVQDKFPEVWQMPEPRGPDHVDPRAMEYQPIQPMQTPKGVGFDGVDVAIVKGQTP